MKNIQIGDLTLLTGANNTGKTKFLKTLGLIFNPIPEDDESHFISHNYTIVEESLLHSRTEDGENNFRDQLRIWLEELHINSFKIEGDYIFIELYQISLGVIKLLYLLEYILTAKQGDTIILENPETNLHPKVQTRLGFLLSKAAQSGIKVVIETHSDHILNSIRVAAKKKWIDPEKVKINFLTHTKEGIEVINPVLDVDGRLDKWPRGFFDEWEDMLSELI